MLTNIQHRKLTQLIAATLLCFCLTGNVFGIKKDIDNPDSEEFFHCICALPKAETKTEQLKTIAREYLKFMQDVFSVPAATAEDPRIESLFTQNLTKIDNRSILFANDRTALYPQMTGFKQGDMIADWILDAESALIIPSEETNTVTINFEWYHPKIGRHTTTAILQCDGDMKIMRIIDVYASMKNSIDQKTADVTAEVLGEIERNGFWKPY